jgi:hypothetical protein
LVNQGGRTTVSTGVVVSQPNTPDLLNNVAGSLAVPAGERALVRTATAPQGTPVQLLVKSLGSPRGEWGCRASKVENQDLNHLAQDRDGLTGEVL